MNNYNFFNTWYNFFEDLITENDYFNKYFTKLLKYISIEFKIGKIYPIKKDVFKCFKITNYEGLKVVIIGNEPHSDGSSNGLLMGINDDINKDINSSLIKIYNCIEKDKGLYFMDHSLERWAKQGVLLLNSSLTSNSKGKNVYSHHWRSFIKYTLLKLSENKTGIIYCLWGNQAKSFKKYINEDNNYILEFKYPKNSKNDWNCTHFNEINKILEYNNGKKFCIKW